jgi:hypothetical protein
VIAPGASAGIALITRHGLHSAPSSGTQPVRISAAPISESTSPFVGQALWRVGSGSASQKARAPIPASSSCVAPFAAAVTNASQTNRPSP